MGTTGSALGDVRPDSKSPGLAAQSVEGLHDDPAERDRLLNSASTLIAHRLADPDPIVTRAGTTKRAERSHQLDPTGATGMGSLRLQDTYRIDPNDLRSLPPGVAWIVTGGRAGKVAISRGGRAPLVSSPRRDRRDNTVVGPGDPALVRASGRAAEAEATANEPPTADGTDVGPVKPEASAEPVGEGTPMGSPEQCEPAAEQPHGPPRSPYAQRP